MLRPGLTPVFAGTQRRFTIALPIATTAAATAPPPPPPVALAECAAFLARLWLARSILLGRTRVVILVGDRMLGDGVLSELLRTFALFAAASAPAASAPSPASSAAFALGVGARFGFRFGRGKLRLLGEIVRVDDLIFDFLDRRGQLWLLSGKRAGSFGRVHLFAAVNDIRLLARYRWIG